ncbi:MAG: TolC family protein [Dysgonomonas mossii]|uniref:TolC family protein n=1 Tax=Dysgonomonas mossii TaxID=163665 RepID=UPI001D573AA4|nr:TolC family protein [Dysgonomonas mossii]MBS5795830.1 TolC family protein [Dysgonomonas mossii]MBS7111290.1 TolC family protein [Dysgonomonas mossii]
MKPIIYILLSVLALSAQAQSSFDNVLKEIEMNNTTLKAYREKANADKIGNKTGINMANPEVEFGYLWGSPSGEGNRVDLNVTQSFDFPTAYRYKTQLSDGKNQQVDMIYDQQKVEILQQARLICVELVYQTKMNKILSNRLKQARELSDAYQKSFDQGNIDVLERNKTKLNLLNAEKALQINEVDLNLSKSELQRLNGGLDITEFNRYPDFTFPLNFIEWFAIVKANNPSLRVAEQEVALSRKQEQLTRALNLPKITAGYASERVSGTTFQGVSVGVSIPLWEGKNTVKHQKAQTVALQMQHEDSELQFGNTLKNQYDKAKKLSLLLKEYEDALSVTSSQDLLKMALDKGQLSLINYLLELSVYYETVDKYLETERDYQLAVAELQQWER